MTSIILSFANRLIPRHTISSPVRNDPRSSAANLLRSFEKKYGEIHVPFYQGSYTQALVTAQRDLQFALVILFSDEHDDTDSFCRNTLTSEHLIDTLQRMDFLVWVGNVSDPEAFQVSSVLQATTYPFIAALSFPVPSNTSTTNNETTTPQSLNVVDRMEGLTAPEDIVRRLSVVHERHVPVYTRLRAERDRVELERRLRQEQERAYQESLWADQEKERRARAEEEARLAEEEEARADAEREEEEQRTLEEKKDQYLHYLYSRLEPEPRQTKEAPITKIRFKMIDGTTVSRSFRGDAPVEALYQFVAVYPLIQRHELVIETDRPREYKHVYDFTILSNYPRIIYPPSDRLISDEDRLWPSATLMVEPSESL
ncbi:hypothetical protein CLU79DRAFT_178167 [Phycomyces nitens]|nr:hypothetical protein CLU79DRAFT_178167 [Phycomyces nitens]